MSDIKLVAVDLDGTVLSSDKTISEENIRAFKFCKQKGIEVVPVTGRPYLGLYKEYIEAIGCNYSIHTNGAKVIDLKSEQSIIEHSLQTKIAKDIVNILENFDCYYSVFYDGIGYLSTERFNYELNRYIGTPMHKYIKITRRPIDSQWDFINNINHCDNIYVNAKTTLIRDEICQAIKDIEDIFFTCSEADDVEIGGNYSKGQSLIELATLLGINPDEIMAIGDGGNDVNMFKQVGMSVAMENANDEVKKEAKYVTKDCENNGVAYAIRKFCI